MSPPRPAEVPTGSTGSVRPALRAHPSYPSYLDHAADGRGDRETYRKGQLIVGLAWAASSLALVKLVIWGSIEVARSSDPAGLLAAVANSDHAPWPWLGFLAALIGFIPLAIILPILIQRMHRRSWRLSVTPFASIDLRQIVRGAALWGGIYLAVAALSALLLHGDLSVGFDLGQFVPGLVVLGLLVPVQAFGQELFFRGYGLQFAALDVRSPRGLSVISGLAFGVPFLIAPFIVRWIVPEVQVPDISWVERIILMLGYVLLGAALARVSVLTGTIELAIGAAFSFNFLTALVLSPSAGSMAGGSVVELADGWLPSLVHVVLLAAGLWLFARIASRWVPDPTAHVVVDHGGQPVAGTHLVLPTGSAMWRVSLRGLLMHRMRLLLTVMAIAIGVSFVVGTMVFADTTNRALNRFFDNEPADVVVAPTDAVTVAPQGGPPVALTMPADIAEKVAPIAGVAAATPHVEQEGVQILDDQGAVAGGANTAHVGASWFLPPQPAGRPAANGAAVGYEGDLPEGVGEVALDTTTAERMGVSIGDTVHLVTPRQTDRDRPWRVTGILDIGLAGGATVALFDLPTAQQVVTGPGRVNQILVTTSTPDVSGSVVQAINAQLGPDAGVRAITGRQATDRAAGEVADSLGFLNTLLTIFAVTALLMSTFLIFNTFAMLVAQRTRELALVRAVGASSRQLRASVLIQALAVGIVGTLMGIAGGVVLSVGLRRVLAAFDIDIPTGGLVITPGMLLLASLAGVGVTALAAFPPALRASRTPPVRAMQSGIVGGGSDDTRRLIVGGIVATLAVATAILAFRDSTPETAVAWMGLSAILAIAGFVVLASLLAAPILRVLALPLRGAVARIGAANTRRNPRRTAATAAALTISIALMTMVSILATSTMATADKEIDRAIGADLAVGAPPLYRPFDHAFTERLRDIPGVADVTFVRSMSGQRGDRSVPVFGVEPSKVREAINLNVVAGDLTDVRGDAVALDSRLADGYGIGVGDDFTATFRTGQRTLDVVAVYDPIIVYEGVLTDLRTAEELGTAAGVDNAAYLRLMPDADPGAVRDQVTHAVSSNPTLQVQDAAVLKQNFRDQIGRLIGLIFAMLALAVVIGVLSIANTLLLAVHERTSEIGMLRAVGATRAQVRAMVVLEAALVGVFGAVTGVLLGLVYGVMLRVVMEPLGITEFELPWPYLLAFIVAGGLAGVAAALAPAVGASRMSILGAMAAE